MNSKTGFSITMQGFDEVEQMLKDKNPIIAENITNANTQIAIFMTSEVKASIAGHRDEHRSVDSGRLMNSITGEASTAQVVVSTDVEYAKYVENNPKIKEGPRQHFKNSLDRNVVKINEYYMDAIERSK
jgi:hypothetical protein